MSKITLLSSGLSPNCSVGRKVMSVMMPTSSEMLELRKSMRMSLLFSEAKIRVALIFYYLCHDFIEINEAFCIYLC